MLVKMLEFFESIIRAIFKTISAAVVVAVAFAGLIAGLFVYNLLRGLPDVAQLKQYRHPHATVVLSSDNRLIGEFTKQRRYPVTFDKIPKHVLWAFIAAEDAHFYEHKGIDFHGIARAALSNLIKGRFAQGASTITQQVARSLLLTSRRKEIIRKLREMILASRMEKSLSKNEILNLYLNEIFLGHGAFGIGAAAQNYFHKRVSDLTLSEAALLAGLPQRPSKWDPFQNPSAAKQRQSYVLKRMVEERYITDNEAKEAFVRPLTLYKLQDPNKQAAPYFTEYVRNALREKYKSQFGDEPEYDSGLRVFTTVRYDFQKAAERALENGIRSVDKRLGWRGVVQHLSSKDQVQVFLQSMHEQILEREIASRILPAAVESGGSLLFDMSALSSPPFFGSTPIKVGEYYLALVIGIDENKKIAAVQIGQTQLQLPLSKMEWVLIDSKPIKRISQILKVGDCVYVQPIQLDRKLMVASLEQEPEIQGAFLSFEVESGAVLAMVGGNHFEKSEFNRALQAKRQVGSTVKPIIYGAAIDKGFSPSSPVTDSPIVFKFEGGDADASWDDWKPRNFSNRFEGEIPLRLALVRSMNVPTVKLLNEIGIDYGIQYARLLGITAPLPRELTIALGSWSSSLEELMRAYVVFPRLGRKGQTYYIRQIIDESGKVLENVTHPDKSEEQVISAQTAYVMTDLLRAVVKEGTGRGASWVNADAAGKTGTSNDHRDAWFIGFTPEVITGVWIGYDRDKPLDPEETGGKAAAPIWAEYMSYVVKQYPKHSFEVPDDIVFANIDRNTGRLATSQTVDRVRVAFRLGTVPNAAGDNIPVVGEPGAPRVTTQEPEEGTALPKKDESGDFIRQGYD